MISGTKDASVSASADESYDFDETAAFAEEEENLAAIETKIEGEVEAAERKAKEYEDRNKGKPPVDREGREAWQEEMDYARRRREHAAKWREYGDSPYFGHVDLEDEAGNIKRVFVGEEALSLNGEQLVCNWLSPIGDTYSNKQELNPVVEGIAYSILLRRNITISDATLRRVITEYDSRNASLQGDVVDPFLLSILRERRASYALGDIIRTIQQKQNEIMRLPIDADFLVQGCAGSGKTMILLHRLAYLAFNYPDVDFSKYALVSPSDDFNSHIDDLAERLKVSSIERYTIDSFYSRLIGKIAFTDVYRDESESRPKEMSKIAVPKAIGHSEDQLGSSLLKEIYSPKFVDEVWGIVDDACARAHDCISASEAKEALALRGVANPSSYKAPYDFFNALGKALKIMAKDGKRLEEELGEVRASIEETIKEIEDVEEPQFPLKDALCLNADHLKQLVEGALVSQDAELENAKAELASLDAALEENTEAVAAQKREIHHAEETLERYKVERDGAAGAIEIYESTGPLGEVVRKACSQSKAEYDLVAEGIAGDNDRDRKSLDAYRENLAAMEDRLRAECVSRLVLSKSDLKARAKEIDTHSESKKHQIFDEMIRLIDDISINSIDVPSLLERKGALYSYAYSLVESEAAAFAEFKANFDEAEEYFARLNEERESIANGSLRKFEEAVDRCVSEAIACIEADCRDASDVLCGLRESGREIRQKNDIAKKAVFEACDRAEISRGMLEAMEAHEYPDLSRFVNRADGALNGAVRAYDELYKASGAADFGEAGISPERLASLRDCLEKETLRKAEIEKELALYAEGGPIGSLLGVVQGMDIRSLRAAMNALLASAYARNGRAYDEAIKYRHQLFATFALCAKYYGRRGVDLACLCVDEAQDVSSAEYKAIRYFFGEETSYNLYGDVNQLICDYRGVSNWTELDGSLPLEKFVLADNYRNTLQVTEYCNREFGQDVVGVGLDGPEVVACSIEEALISLAAFGGEHPGARLALIHVCDRESVRSAIEDVFGNKISWDLADPSVLSVMDVSKSKGLEFDAVAVVADGMSVNERYIACTRTLDSLWVTTAGAQRDDKHASEDGSDGDASVLSEFLEGGSIPLQDDESDALFMLRDMLVCVVDRGRLSLEDAGLLKAWLGASCMRKGHVVFNSLKAAVDLVTGDGSLEEGHDEKMIVLFEEIVNRIGLYERMKDSYAVGHRVGIDLSVSVRTFHLG